MVGPLPIEQTGGTNLRLKKNPNETILIAHRDVGFATLLESQLRNAGYRVITCAGPAPHVERRTRCDTNHCSHSDGVDLMIYDPLLTAVNAHGDRHHLASDSALAHPDVPMLLAWSPADVPEFGTLRGIRNLAPYVRAPPRSPRVSYARFTMRWFRPNSRLHSSSASGHEVMIHGEVFTTP